MIRLIFLILISVSFSSFAKDEFVHNFDIDMEQNSDIADQVAEFYAGKKDLNLPSSLNTLVTLDKKISILIQRTQKSPQLYFLKGLNSSLLSSVYAIFNDPKLSRTQKDRVYYYKKAIQLDNQQEPLLSANAYATIKSALPEDYKIQAIQKELSLGGNGDTESQYWYLHWSNINALKEAKRFKEAEQAFNNMQQELKQQGLEKSVFNTISSRAKTELNTAIKSTPAPSEKNKTTGTSKQSTEMKPITKIIILVIILFTLGLIASKAYEFINRK